MGKRGPKPKKFINTAWTPGLAYAVGLITTDGCLSKDGRHIDFTSKDLEQIKTLKKILGLKIKIGKKISGSANKKDYFRIQFGGIMFYNWLVSLGLTPNKSKTLQKIKIPDEYFFDFLRGCFDGDGSMYAYWDPRWHSSYMFYLQFASASPSFLKWLQKKNYRLALVKGKIDQSSTTQQLRYAKRETQLLFKKMFYKEKIPFLKRKFTKAQKIFKINKQHNAQVEKQVNSYA